MNNPINSSLYEQRTLYGNIPFCKISYVPTHLKYWRFVKKKKKIICSLMIKFGQITFNQKDSVIICLFASICCPTYGSESFRKFSCFVLARLGLESLHILIRWSFCPLYLFVFNVTMFFVCCCFPHKIIMTCFAGKVSMEAVIIKRYYNSIINYLLNDY